MKSTASFKSHPIHPMLIPFPFVFLSGGWGFRVAAAMTGNDELKTVSRYLVPAGLVAGLVAAVPGAIDYLGSVPPQSSAKERATKHAHLNVSRSDARERVTPRFRIAARTGADRCPTARWCAAPSSVRGTARSSMCTLAR